MHPCLLSLCIVSPYHACCVLLELSVACGCCCCWLRPISPKSTGGEGTGTGKGEKKRGRQTTVRCAALCLLSVSADLDCSSPTDPILPLVGLVWFSSFQAPLDFSGLGRSRLLVGCRVVRTRLPPFLCMSVPASPAVAGATTPGMGSPSSAAGSPSPPPTADGQPQPPPRKRSMVMGTSVPTSFALGSFVPIQEANWSVLEALRVSTRSSLSRPCNRALPLSSLQTCPAVQRGSQAAQRGSQATAILPADVAPPGERSSRELNDSMRLAVPLSCVVRGGRVQGER
jgi:hypothetical protein